MPKISKKISFQSLQELLLGSTLKIKAFLWFVGKHSFLCILVLFLINISFGEFLFYRYTAISKSDKFKSFDTPIIFQENTYLFVIGELEKRKNIFNNSLEQYNDPFQ